MSNSFNFELRIGKELKDLNSEFNIQHSKFIIDSKEYQLGNTAIDAKVAGTKNLQASCMVPIKEGMVIKTNSLKMQH